MKKIAILLSFVTVLLSSCNLDNSGFPKKVQFGGAGGTRVVEGDETPVFFDITDYNGKGNGMNELWDTIYGDSFRDSIRVSYLWLTASGSLRNNKITITAEPNTSPKNRTLFIHVGVPTNFEPVDIKVVQAGGGF